MFPGWPGYAASERPVPGVSPARPAPGGVRHADGPLARGGRSRLGPAVDVNGARDLGPETAVGKAGAKEPPAARVKS